MAPSTVVKHRVVALHQQGMRPCDIARLIESQDGIKVPGTTVRRIITKWKNHQTVERLPGTGRISIVSDWYYFNIFRKLILFSWSIAIVQFVFFFFFFWNSNPFEKYLNKWINSKYIGSLLYLLLFLFLDRSLRGRDNTLKELWKLMMRQHWLSFRSPWLMKELILAHQQLTKSEGILASPSKVNFFCYIQF